jgi:hypothetical protein
LRRSSKTRAGRPNRRNERLDRMRAGVTSSCRHCGPEASYNSRHTARENTATRFFWPAGDPFGDEGTDWRHAPDANNRRVQRPSQPLEIGRVELFKSFSVVLGLRASRHGCLIAGTGTFESQCGQVHLRRVWSTGPPG